MEAYKVIQIKSKQGVSLLQAEIVWDGCTMEVCGLAKEGYEDGFVLQWWILMEKGERQAKACLSYCFCSWQPFVAGQEIKCIRPVCFVIDRWRNLYYNYICGGVRCGTEPGITVYYG